MDAGAGREPEWSDRVDRAVSGAPLAGFEPALPPPEGGALSPELQGLGVRTRGYPNADPFLISGGAPRKGVVRLDR